MSVSVIGVAAALVLAGCSDGDGDGDGHDMDSMGGSSMSQTASGNTSSAETTAQFNDADVMFAQMMYPHHAQAVEMADLVQGRTTNPQIIELAAAIKSAQGPEMTQLQQWLAQWGKPAPTTGADMGGMDHGGSGGMSGMMSEQDMTDLAGKNGAEFDQAWLTMMIEHHTGAIEMANTEIADGSNEQAKQLARTIVQTQQTEIDTMKALQTQ
jgi:uncharacterized protein (DUF305 family)